MDMKLTLSTINSFESGCYLVTLKNGQKFNAYLENGIFYSPNLDGLDEDERNRMIFDMNEIIVLEKLSFNRHEYIKLLGSMKAKSDRIEIELRQLQLINAAKQAGMNLDFFSKEEKKTIPFQPKLVKEENQILNEKDSSEVVTIAEVKDGNKQNFLNEIKPINPATIQNVVFEKKVPITTEKVANRSNHNSDGVVIDLPLKSQ